MFKLFPNPSLSTTLYKNYRNNLRYLALLSVGLLAHPVKATITDPAEITYLEQFYSDTNGSGWTDNSGWLSGDPCDDDWYGITCNTAETSVTKIELFMNELTGTIPANLADLSNLEEFQVTLNSLSGDIPQINQLANLRLFSVSDNQMTGTIPSLTGLTTLLDFYVSNNQLEGQIPDLSSLTNLQDFIVAQNNLSGNLPAINMFADLQTFIVSGNQFDGEIPDLSGLNNLAYFQVDNNQLSGEIPALNSLTNLVYFDVSANQLQGNLPNLSGLSNLWYFAASANRLEGQIPELASLTSLLNFKVNDNMLTGEAPNPPTSLNAGQSSLCPNYLQQVDNADWDTATGETPWHATCTDAPTPEPPKPEPRVQKIPALSSWMLLVGLGLLSLLAATVIRQR